jgi:hypothetical protein
MSDLATLKIRISKAGYEGIKTAQIRDDYEPIGDMLIRDLLASGDYLTMRVRTGVIDSAWFIFEKSHAPCHL